MRKIYLAFLSLIIFSTLNTRLNAQAVGTYVFSPSSGTYAALTGTTTSSATADDGTQNVAIGFNFVFGGVTYTNAVISTNGAIKLAADGATGFATSWTNALGNAYGFPIIGPAWDDNNATGGSVVYVTSGTAPNRTFSVEWLNIHMGGGGSTTTPTGTFQLKLSEGTNAIQFVYGTINPLTSSSIGIGLNDLVSFLSVTPGTPATASSATANNTIASAANMPSGTTYTFLPPPPCVAPPGGGTTVSSVASACASTPFNLSVTGASFGTGLTYLWETSPTGVAPWTSTGVTTAGYTVASQTTATYYRRRITCSAQDAYSTVLLVGQNAPSACYCPVTFTSNVEPITLVNFSNINNATSATVNGTPPLENFTSIVGNVSKGQAYTMTVKGNTDGNFTTRVDVYIDFNQDGDFVDAGEAFFIGTIINSTGLDAVQASASITIPGSALDGNTRMRVMKKFNTSALPCNTDGFGQAEDYTLNITTPLCLAPSGVSVGTITATSAAVTFTSGGGTAYVEYGLAGFTPGTGAVAGAGGTLVSPATSPQAIGPLLPNTAYDVYVRRDCGGGIFSGNTSAVNFRTLCNPIATFPYTETFEAASTTRPCWTSAITAGSVNWTYGAGAGNGGPVTTAHSGTVNARYFGGGTGSVGKLISPALNFSTMPAQGAQVTFWYANANWAGDQNELRVYYKTTAAGAWTQIPGAVYITNVGAWTEVELALPGSSGPSDYYVAFEGVELFGWGVAVDDVTFAIAPTCPKPTNVSALGITPTSVMVNFTSPGTAFLVEYGAPGFVPGTGATAGVGGTIVPGGSSPILVAGLTPGTAYDFYVRRVCVPGVDFSINVKATASTLCTATNIPYVQNFETSVPLVGFPTCTSMEDVNGSSGPTPNAEGGRWITNNIAQTYVSPTRSLWYIYDLVNPARGGDDWFYLQGLNLTAGTTYRVKAYYKGSDAPTWTEKFEIKYGTGAHSSMMTNLIYSNPGTTTATANPFDSLIADFTPSASGVYYVGFHNISNPDQAFLFIDDISVRVAPKVDVGITGLVLPTLNCPTSGVFVQATIRNFNTVVQNFATYPVTITANITGAGTGTLTTTLNSGTLAPGASMTVYLNPAFNFTAGGTYNITTTTSSPDDPETGNDSYTRSLNVNPNPTTPVITPSTAQLCVGQGVLLSTQFTNPPPAPITLPAVTSGTITVVVPDGLAGGITHSLNVSGVPAGATVTGVRVEIISLTHTWVSDMVVNLRGPNGKILNLFNARGADGDNMTNMVISSTATNSLGAAAPPFTGEYLPDAAIGVGPTGFASDVATFQAVSTVGNGAWTLGLRDLFGLDVGTLRSWSITLTYQMANPVVTWTPVSGLFTNATATTAYTAGTDAFSVYSKPATAGTYPYTATATNSAGCTSSATAIVTVNAPTAVTLGAIPDTVCISDQVIALTANPVGGNWTGIGVSGTNFIPPATAVGTYTLNYTYTSAAGCATTVSKSIAVKDCPDRIRLLRDDAVILYPNPNNGLFNIRINSVLYNSLGMKVFANNGTLVRTQQFGGLAYGRVVPIDLTNLPGGVYLVKFYYVAGVRTSEKSFKVIIGTP
jgi:subtilisin-like proprotein convertase family protein